MLAGTLAFGWSSRARASDVSDTDRQIAQSLFDEARSLLEAGRIAEACPKLVASQRLDPGGGTLLNLALCFELQGLNASAWARYQEALSLAIRDGRKDREEFARSHLDALTPKLIRIVFLGTDKTPSSTTLGLDDSRVAREAWGTPIAVDPGRHKIRVETPGVPAREVSLDLSEAGRTYRFDVQVDDVSAAAPPHDAGTPAPETHRTVAAKVLAGGALAALVAGGVVGAFALSADGEAKRGCIPERSYCSPSALDESDRARRLAWISTGLMVGGVVSGVVAFLLPRGTTTTNVNVNVGVSAGAASLGLSRSF